VFTHVEEEGLLCSHSLLLPPRVAVAVPIAVTLLQTNAITNVMWTDRLRAWYSQHVKGGLVFTHVEEEGLFGRAALRGQSVVDNNPSNDSMPKGHPRVNGVASMPLLCGTPHPPPFPPPPSESVQCIVECGLGGSGQTSVLPPPPSFHCRPTTAGPIMLGMAVVANRIGGYSPGLFLT